MTQCLAQSRAGSPTALQCARKGGSPIAGTLGRSSHLGGEPCSGGEAVTLSSRVLLCLLLVTEKVVLGKRRLQDHLIVAFQSLKGLQEH